MPLLLLAPHSAPTEILAKIDEGGMGEVWQARDTKLNRQVALNGTVKLMKTRRTDSQDDGLQSCCGPGMLG